MKRMIEGFIVVVLLVLVLLQIPAISQSSITWDGLLPKINTVTGGTDSINVSIVAGSGFLISPYELIEAATYTLAATNKGQNFVIDYTDTGAASFTITTLSAVDGRTITIKDGDLNAATNNITIGTEGAETIDEAATYAMNADGEAVTLMSDGTNWRVMNGYLE